jgi:hypothetical protein
MCLILFYGYTAQIVTKTIRSDKESPQPVIDHDTRDALLQDPALKKYYKRLEPLKYVMFFD